MHDNNSSDKVVMMMNAFTMKSYVWHAHTTHTIR